MPKITLYYTVVNKGDGSAGLRFHADKESAQIACDIEDEGGEAFGNNYPISITLEFNENGTLLNPTETKEELRQQLAELRGEEVEEDIFEPPASPEPSP